MSKKAITAIRTLLAVLLSPLSVFLSVPLCALTFWRGNFHSLSDVTLISTGSLLFAFPSMLILGLPLYLVMLWRHWVSIWSCALLGVVVAMLATVLLMVGGAVENWHAGNKAEYAFQPVEFLLQQPWDLLQMQDVLGAGIGMTFWLIAAFPKSRVRA